MSWKPTPTFPEQAHHTSFPFCFQSTLLSFWQIYPTIFFHGLPSTPSTIFTTSLKISHSKRPQRTMAMAVDMTMWIAKMVWIALGGWISSCLTVADEVASSLRSGDIGPFHVGWSKFHVTKRFWYPFHEPW